MITRSYKVGQSEIKLIFGDITQSHADVIVSSDDRRLSMGGGVSRAILKAAGERIADETAKMIPAQPGDVIVTSAGKLPARYVFHAVTIGPRTRELPSGAIVRQATSRVLQLLPALRCRSVAFPAIGAGVAGVPLETVATEMASILIEGLLDSTSSLAVELYLHDRFASLDPTEFFVFFEQFAARTTGVQLGRDGRLAPEAPAADQPNASNTTAFPEPDSSDTRHHEITHMLRRLTARRSQLESQLLTMITAEELTPATPDGPTRPFTGVDPSAIAQIRSNLGEVSALLRQYQSQLARPAPGGRALASADNSVFVSSTSQDLQPHRRIVREVLDGIHFRFIGMEDFPPSSSAPGEYIQQRVREARIYLGVIGMRYGCVDPGTGISMTELEYRQAAADLKPVYMYVMDPSAPITPQMVESDPEAYAKLCAFKQHLMRERTCSMFTTPEDLGIKVRAALESV